MGKIEIDIHSRGKESCVYQSNCFNALKKLRKNNYEIISLEDVARLIMQEGENSRIANQRFYTREGIFSTSEGLYLLKDSYILEHPKRATKYNLKNKNFTISEREKLEILENSLEIPKDIKPKIINLEKGDILFNQIFSNYAIEFKNFLAKKGINNLDIRLPEKSKKPFISQIMFLGIKEGIYSAEGGLDNKENYWRGIKDYNIGDF
jgi:hypothetical protein